MSEQIEKNKRKNEQVSDTFLWRLAHPRSHIVISSVAGTIGILSVLILFAIQPTMGYILAVIPMNGTWVFIYLALMTCCATLSTYLIPDRFARSFLAKFTVNTILTLIMFVLLAIPIQVVISQFIPY